MIKPRVHDRYLHKPTNRRLRVMWVEDDLVRMEGIDNKPQYVATSDLNNKQAWEKLP